MMKKIKTKIICGVLAISAISGSIHVYAQAGSGIPTVDAGVLGEVAAVGTTLNDSYLEFQNQTRALTEKIQALNNISNAAAMQALQGGVQQLNLQMDSAMRDAASTGSLQKILEANQTTTKAASEFHARQVNNMPEESQRIDAIVRSSNQATGTLQAQQAGNQLVGELTQQVQGLRAATAAQAQVQNAALTAQQKEEETQRRLTAAALGFQIGEGGRLIPRNNNSSASH